MAIEVKKKQREPVNRFLRRFSDKIKRSGIIKQYKTSKIRIKPKSRRMRKVAALEKKKHQEHLEYLKKTGNIP